MLTVGRLRRDYEAAARRLASAAIAPEQLADLQLTSLRRVWQDAVDDVPYYGSLVEAGLAPRELRGWDDVAAIPELNRGILQDRAGDFQRRSSKPESHARTGGSTATPIEIGMNQSERDLMRIVKLSAWQSFGYQPSSRLFLIWGHAHLLGTGWRGRVNHARRKITDAVLGYQRVDAYRLSPSICRDYAERLIRFAPHGVIGYMSALDLFARYTQEYRARFHALKLAFVLATSEAPPRADTTKTIEDLFGCPVVQEYGGAEFGQVAFKRGEEPFEVYSDLNYLECRGQSADEALVTTLYPRYTPLIRYRIGDLLEQPVTLAHGHVTHFARVVGRSNDMVLMDDGQSVHGLGLLHCFHQEKAIHNVQIVFADEGIEIRLIADDVDRPALEARLRARLAQVHHALPLAQFRYVDDLETNRAGKRRWYVDRRSPNAGAIG